MSSAQFPLLLISNVSTVYSLQVMNQNRYICINFILMKSTDYSDSFSFLLKDPILASTLHLVVMSPRLLLVVTVSQTLLVFNDLDSFKENVRYILGCSSVRICLIFFS